MRVLVLVLALACAVFPTAASGAITVGSDLSSSADALLGCPTAEPCTGVQTQLPGRQITSPIDGVVVLWRVGDGEGPLAFRVVRDAGGGSFTGVGRSATVTPSTPLRRGAASDHLDVRDPHSCSRRGLRWRRPRA